MVAIQSFIRRHPVLAYFVLTFILSWGGILLVVAPAGFSGSTAHRLFPYALVANEAGPLVAGILLTVLVYGKAGLRLFRSRLLRRRVGLRWYGVALLATPLLVTVLLLTLSLYSPVFLPGISAAEDKASLLLLGIGVGIFGGLFEEPGWTGFAVPELRRRYSILTTGLIVGLMWCVWHLPLTIWTSGDAVGMFARALFLLPPFVFYVGVLPAFRVLMVWVYDRTESLLLAILMHAGLIFSTLFVLSPLNEVAVTTWHLILAAVLWGVVAAIAAANGGHLARPGAPPAGLDSSRLSPR